MNITENETPSKKKKNVNETDGARIFFHRFFEKTLFLLKIKIIVVTIFFDAEVAACVK